MPRFLGWAALLGTGLVIGTAFGYWLRGPSAERPVDLNPAEPQVSKLPETKLPETKVPEEEPLGTEVAVKPPVAPTPTATPTPTQAPPQTAPAAEPAPDRGRLLVRSVPSGATVTVNGRDRGTTPAAIRDLAFGTYTIAVSRSGYQRREQKIAVSTSVPAREITLELTPVRAAAPAASGAPAVTTGSVDVTSTPSGATVSIDGRVVGTAPMRVLELTPGSHAVRITLAGHKTINTTVVVRAGQPTPLRVRLEIQ